MVPNNMKNETPNTNLDKRANKNRCYKGYVSFYSNGFFVEIADTANITSLYLN